MDSNRYSKLIEWKNRQGLIFKILDPKEISRLWGIRKSNQSMDYGKFSRGLRDARKRGFFEKLSHNDKISGSHFLMKFGEKSISRNKWLQELKNGD
jgi:hypothetical protein